MLAMTIIASLTILAKAFQWDWTSHKNRLEDQAIDDMHVCFKRDMYGTRHEYRRVLGGWIHVASYPVKL